MVTPLICEKFFSQPTINPLTQRSINIKGPTYNKLIEDCANIGLKPDIVGSEDTLSSIHRSRLPMPPSRSRLPIPPSRSRLPMPPSPPIYTPPTPPVVKPLYIRRSKLFSISSLICSLFNGDHESLLQGANLCNPISNKVASVMIRVAVTRIFADPAQSIMELPINSIDSYRRLRAKEKGLPPPPSVGKFGMGFFSILYWLIDHPERFLRIYSIHQGVDWYLQIQEVDGELMGSFLNLPPRTPLPPPDILPFLTLEKGDHGTSMGLFDPNGTLNIKQFHHHINRLTFISDVSFDVRSDINQPFSIKPDVEITLNPNYVIVTDSAEGIPVDILFSSLLVPTISTKTIEKSLNVEIPFINTSRVLSSINELSGLAISVGDIIVVFDLPGSKTDLLYLVTLPLNTPLPVSRDDIIINSQIKTLMFEGLVQIANQCLMEGYDLQILFSYLSTYAKYNGQLAVSQLIQELKEYVLNRPDVIFFPSATIPLIMQPYLPIRLNHLIDAPVAQSSQQLNKYLDAYDQEIGISFNTREIFKNIRLIFLPDPDFKITNGDLGSYIFVSRSMLQFPDWEDRIASSFPNAILRRYLDPEPSIPQSAWPQFYEEYDMYPSIPGFHYNPDLTLMESFLPLLNILYATIEAKILSFGRAIQIRTTLNRFFYNCLMAINAFIVVADTPEQITEYIEQLILIINKFQIKVGYGNTKQIKLEYTNKFLNIYLGDDREKIQKVYSPTLINNPNYRAKTRESLYRSLVLNLQEDSILRDDELFLIDIRNFPTSLLLSISEGNSDQENITLYLYSKIRTGFEGYLILLILESYYPEDGVNVFTLENINYLLTEIRYRYSDDFLDQWNKIRKLPEREKFQIFNIEKDDPTIRYHQLFIQPMVTALDLKIKSNQVMELIPCSPFILPKFKFRFTANQLIDFVFSQSTPIITHDVNHQSLFSVLSQVQRHRMDPTRPQFQSVQIAVNEGTTKPFIPSVLTELSQNSIDAIRSAVGSGRQIEERIDITMCDLPNSLELTFQDYVGIPDPAFLSLWIPFLSFKSTSDLMTTGEMGTGFFNVYRQPYTKEVIIKTNNLIIVATPIVKLNRVVDIQYQVGTGSFITGTQIIIRFNEMSVDEIITQKIDLFTYTYNFLPTIPFPVTINGQNVEVTSKIIYETEVGKVSMVTGRSLPSILLTNGIPLSDLTSYLELVFNGEINTKLMTNVIIDINKGYYQPIQSRNRLGKFKDEFLIKKFLKDSMFRVLIHHLKYGDLNTYLPQYTASAPLTQFMGWRGSDIKITPQDRFTNYLGINYLHTGYINFETIIRRMISDYLRSQLPVNAINTEKEINQFIAPDEYEIRKLIHGWFSRKNNNKQERPKLTGAEEKELNMIVNNLSRMQRILQLFIITYYEVGSTLGFTKGAIFDRYPEIKFDKIHAATAGHYNTQTHEIVLSVDVFAAEQSSFLQAIQNLIKLYQNDTITAIRYFRTNPTLRKIMGNNSPAPTLIHELLHALNHSDHNSDIDVHGSNDYTIDGITSRWNFDEACFNIYTLEMEHGFFDRFISEIMVN